MRDAFSWVSMAPLLQAKELKSKYTGVSSDMMRNRLGGSSAGGSTGVHHDVPLSCSAMLQMQLKQQHIVSAPCSAMATPRLFMAGGRYYDDDDDDDIYATRESRNGGSRGDRGAIGQSSRSESDPMEATR
jgi:hypothetical protein